jgi:hypothetical protein
MSSAQVGYMMRCVHVRPIDLDFYSEEPNLEAADNRRLYIFQSCASTPSKGITRTNTGIDVSERELLQMTGENFRSEPASALTTEALCNSNLQQCKQTYFD